MLSTEILIYLHVPECGLGSWKYAETSGVALDSKIGLGPKEEAGALTGYSIRRGSSVCKITYWVGDRNLNTRGGRL